jgi:hypothetical protein
LERGKSQPPQARATPSGRKTAIANVAGKLPNNLALNRNALLAIIPIDEKRNLPSLIAHHQQNPQLAINLILHARPLI